MYFIIIVIKRIFLEEILAISAIIFPYLARICTNTNQFQLQKIAFVISSKIAKTNKKKFKKPAEPW